MINKAKHFLHYRLEFAFFFLYIFVFLLESSTRELLVLKSNLIINLSPILDQTFIIIARKFNFFLASFLLLLSYLFRNLILDSDSDYLNNIKTLLTSGIISKKTIHLIIVFCHLVAFSFSKQYGITNIIFILVFMGLLYLPLLPSIKAFENKNFLFFNLLKTLPILFLNVFMILLFENKYFFEFIKNQRDLFFTFTLFLCFLFFYLSPLTFAPEEERANLKSLSSETSYYLAFLLKMILLISILVSHFYLASTTPNLGAVSNDRTIIICLFFLILFFIPSLLFLTTLQKKWASFFRKSLKILSILLLIHLLSTYLI